MTRAQLVDGLRALADQRGLTDRELARHARVHRRTVSRMWRHETATDLDIVVRVARALGAELTLLVPRGPLAVPNSQHDRATGLSIFSDSGAESERDGGGDCVRGPGDT